MYHQPLLTFFLTSAIRREMLIMTNLSLCRYSNTSSCNNYNFWEPKQKLQDLFCNLTTQILVFCFLARMKWLTRHFFNGVTSTRPNTLTAADPHSRIPWFVYNFNLKKLAITSDHGSARQSSAPQRKHFTVHFILFYLVLFFKRSLAISFPWRNA